MQNIAILSGILNLVGTGFYIFEIIKRRSIPERTTWLIWTLLGFVVFLTQKSLGAHHILWFIALQTLGVAIVFGLSLKYGTGGLSKVDLLTLVAALCTAVLWFLTDQPLIALLMVVLTRAIAVSATIRKTYHSPQTEAALPWLIYACSAFLALISVDELRFGLVIYPTYLILADSAVMFAKYHKFLQVSRVMQETSSRSRQED